MRVYRLDGVDTAICPEDVVDGYEHCASAEPHAYEGFPHKLEYLDTEKTPLEWKLVCDNPRMLGRELARIMNAHSAAPIPADVMKRDPWDCCPKRDLLLAAEKVLQEVLRDTNVGQIRAFDLAAKLYRLLPPSISA